MSELPGFAAAHAHAILDALVEHDSRAEIVLSFAEPAPLLTARSGRQVDDVLQEALRQGFIEGDRGEGDGSISWWSRVRLTAMGLQLLGQWPPAGRESEPGGWDHGYWGRRARPLLERLKESPPHHGYLFKPIGEPTEAWLEWTTALVLGDAYLISGTLNDEGIDGLRLTAAGMRAVEPTPLDPLDDALAKLRSGARVDAVVSAVELALGARLKEIATKANIPVLSPSGAPLTLSRLNNDLRATGVYSETDRAQVDAWLKSRNELAHAHPNSPSYARVEAMIAGIRVFLDEHPG